MQILFNENLKNKDIHNRDSNFSELILFIEDFGVGPTEEVVK